MATDPKSTETEHQSGVDEELGFDPESPDVSDPAVDPLHPALTDNDPVPKGKRPAKQDGEPSFRRGGV